jgi:hypothetical protein
MLTQFTASTTASQFVVFNSIQQLPNVITDSIASPQPIILFCRKLDPTLLRFITSGISTCDLPLLYSCLSHSAFIEKLETVRSTETRFPYANLGPALPPSSGEKEFDGSITFPNLSQSQTLTHRVKPTDFNFLRMHLFKCIHCVISVSVIDELKDAEKSYFMKWDRSDVMPQTDNPLIQRLFTLMLSNNEKSSVNVLHHLSKVVTRFDFLIKRINQYIDQRHQFIQQVLLVVRSIEQSIQDVSESISSTERQIEIDEHFLETHVQAVTYRRQVVVELNGDMARKKAEFDDTTAKYAEFQAYKERDSVNTSTAVDQATKLIMKAFTQEEQYKLYAQQHPSPEVHHLFNTYCILREFTPRAENDYWPEARILLKSGRFHRTITVFDKDQIKREVLLQFDVMMNSPLIHIKNFPENSASHALAVWIAAVHRHTQSTNFNSSVSQQMLEIMKVKSRQEAEIAELGDKLRAADLDLENHQHSLEELKTKISSEKKNLETLKEFHRQATLVAKCFPTVNTDLQAFVKGEGKCGQNLSGFVLITVGRSVVLPLFPASSHDMIKRQIDEILQDSQFSSEFFLTICDIIGADDPVVLSILSGDRLVCVFDPHDSEFQFLGGLTGHCKIPSLNTFDFVYTDPSCPTFCLDVVRAAETGCILIIRHADSVLSNPFLNSIASSSVTSGPFYEKLTNISPRFRVIFLIERPPKSLNPHMTFIQSGEIGLQRVSAVLINDDLPVIASTKRMTSEMMLHAQRENLYLSFQHLTDRLSKIHSCDCEALGDVLLQSQLFEMALKNYEDSVVVDEHSLDGSPWVTNLAAQMLQFLQDLQDLYQISPLYLWPFSKLRELIEELRESEDLMEDLLKWVASTMFSAHRWTVDKLKKVRPLKTSSIT